MFICDTDFSIIHNHTLSYEALPQMNMEDVFSTLLKRLEAILQTSSNTISSEC